MVPRIQPAIIPRIDETLIVKTATELLGYSPTKALDSHPRPLSEGARLLVILASFQDGKLENALEPLRGRIDLLNHLQYSFIVYADDETVQQIMERTDLSVSMTESLSKDRAAFVSGTLKEWYMATLTCCQKSQPYNLRVLFDVTMLMFEKLGFSEIWHGVRKSSLPDKTFYLEHK